MQNVILILEPIECQKEKLTSKYSHGIDKHPFIISAHFGETDVWKKQIFSTLVITKPKAESGNYQRERPMLHMLKLKSPENAR